MKTIAEVVSLRWMTGSQFAAVVSALIFAALLLAYASPQPPQPPKQNQVLQTVVRGAAP